GMSSSVRIWNSPRWPCTRVPYESGPKPPLSGGRASSRQAHASDTTAIPIVRATILRAVSMGELLREIADPGVGGSARFEVFAPAHAWPVPPRFDDLDEQLEGLEDWRILVPAEVLPVGGASAKDALLRPLQPHQARREQQPDGGDEVPLGNRLGRL